jgi:hypothetical protein
MAVAQWRQMRQMPHFWNGKCNLLKANKIFFFFKICLNSPPLPHFIQTRPTAVHEVVQMNCPLHTVYVFVPIKNPLLKKVATNVFQFIYLFICLFVVCLFFNQVWRIFVNVSYKIILNHPGSMPADSIWLLAFSRYKVINMEPTPERAVDVVIVWLLVLQLPVQLNQCK